MRLIAGLAVSAAILAPSVSAQVRLADEFDRAAFRAWFVSIADAQFSRPAADVTDCAALVRHAFREALRAHTTEWQRQHGGIAAPAFPDVRRPPQPRGASWPLFRTAGGELAEFADAKTIVRFNARPIGRAVEAARAGDLLYFHQAGATAPDHLMIVVGASASEDWIVYHTGPDEEGAGDVRKTRLATLLQHPSPRWRPRVENPNFIGVFRLAILEPGASR